MSVRSLSSGPSVYNEVAATPEDTQPLNPSISLTYAKFTLELNQEQKSLISRLLMTHNQITAPKMKENLKNEITKLSDKIEIITNKRKFNTIKLESQLKKAKTEHPHTQKEKVENLEKLIVEDFNTIEQDKAKVAEKKGQIAELDEDMRIETETILLMDSLVPHL